jgi:hypothetical protein
MGQGTGTADQGTVATMRPALWSRLAARIFALFEGSGEVYSFSNPRYHQANETAVGGSHGRR